MTPQDALAEYAAWLDASSRAGSTPLGGRLSKGRFASIVPSALDAPPMAGFSRDALPLFVPAEQAVGIDTGLIEVDAPDSQDRIAMRLTQLLWKREAKALPPALFLGFDDGRFSLRDIMAGKDIADATLGSTLILFTPLYGLSAFDRATIIAKFRLP